MSGDWIVERARPGQCHRIAAMLRLSVPAPLRRFTVWASPRAGRYIRAVLMGAFPEEAHELYALSRGRRPAGVAAFRQLDGAAFLNQLWVAPRWRGEGLGRRLLETAARSYLARHPARRLALDVFSGASPAEAWYERLGFVECGRSAWWLRTGAAARGIPGPRVTDRQHRLWGFSQLTVRTPSGRCYQVGRLFTSYFRLTEMAAALDAELRQKLRQMDGKRRLMLVGPESFSDPAWRQVAWTRRLEVDAGTLLQHLGRSM